MLKQKCLDGYDKQEVAKYILEIGNGMGVGELVTDPKDQLIMITQTTQQMIMLKLSERYTMNQH